LDAGVVSPGAPAVDARASHRSSAHLALAHLASTVSKTSTNHAARHRSGGAAARVDAEVADAAAKALDIIVAGRGSRCPDLVIIRKSNGGVTP
jgi:hypothetical protein